jgi:hypothetical protein
MDELNKCGLNPKKQNASSGHRMGGGAAAFEAVLMTCVIARPSFTLGIPAPTTRSLRDLSRELA